MNWTPIDIEWYDRITFSNKYSKKPTNNIKYDELMLIQHYKNGEFVSKRNEDLIPDYFLAEMDDLSLEEQKKVYERLEKEGKLKYIKCITFSGNKSLHCIVPINDSLKEKCCDRIVYKTIWEQTINFIFGDNYKDVDIQNSSRGKYFRNPNGLRMNDDKTVTKQTCYYFNKKCVSLKSLQEKAYKIAEKKLRFIEEQNKINDTLFKDTKGVERDLDFLANIKKETDNLIICKNVLLYNQFPKGVSYVSGFWTLVNMNFSKEVIKRYCDLVSQHHPTNLAPSFWDKNKHKIGGI